MEIIQIAAVGMVAAILAITIKKQAPDIAIMISICIGIYIMMALIPKISVVIEVISRIAEIAGTNNEYIILVLKIIGIAYISEFASQICADAKETAIASKIEIAGKILIMITAMPVMLSLLNLIFTIV